MKFLDTKYFGFSLGLVDKREGSFLHILFCVQDMKAMRMVTASILIRRHTFS